MLVVNKVSVLIHILCAMFWLGGMLFTALVIVPTTRHHLIASKRGLLFSLMGKRFSNISWILFIILFITGYIQLWTRGYTLTHLFSTNFWHTNFGTSLAYKLIAFSIMLIISGVHDFWLGPKAAELIDTQPESDKTKAVRKAASWIGRLNLLLGIIIIYFAITLVRG